MFFAKIIQVIFYDFSKKSLTEFSWTITYSSLPSEIIMTNSTFLTGLSINAYFSGAMN